VQGQAEQPRVLLVGVPYAMKAADAETIGAARGTASGSASWHRQSTVRQTLFRAKALRSLFLLARGRLA